MQAERRLKVLLDLSRDRPGAGKVSAVLAGAASRLCWTGT